MKKSRRRTLGLLAALFVAPVAVSFFLYYGLDGWGAGGAVNRGELISPARPLPAVSLTTAAGTDTGAEFLRGKWSLIYVDRMDSGACDKRCRDALYQIRQIRLTFNEKAERIQRVLLYSGTCCQEPFFSREHEGLIAAGLDSMAGARVLQVFTMTGETPPMETGRIYLSDPLGNLMMSYPTQASAGDIREDLKRLLKLSHIG